MIVRAIDGRFLGHPFFSPSKKNGHGNGRRQRPNSYHPNSLYICVGPRRSLAVCVGARRSLCRAQALSMCQIQALSMCRGPALPALSVSPALSASGSVSGPGGLPLSVRAPAFLCGTVPGPALSPTALCMSGSRRSFVGQRSLCQARALSVSGLGALCVGPRRSLPSTGTRQIRHPSASDVFPSHPYPRATPGPDPAPGPSSNLRATHPVPKKPGAAIRAPTSCHPLAIRSAGPGPAPIPPVCGPPPIQPGAFPFPGKNPNFSVWRKNWKDCKLGSPQLEHWAGRWEIRLANIGGRVD